MTILGRDLTGYAHYRIETLGFQLRWIRVYARHRALRRAGNMLRCGRRGRWRMHGGQLRAGDRLVMRDGYFVYLKGKLTIGSNVFINRDAFISVHGEACIGDDVRLGERCSIHDENHVFEPVPVIGARRNEYEVRRVSIGDRVWLGANCVVVAGATIGDDSVTAANSMVRGTIPPRVLAGGVPARVIQPLRAERTVLEAPESVNAGERSAAS
jgi:acetyltransferase-like isoleucine patch superfamily enzyme